ncbi:ABC-2 type transport system permease [Enterococcus sp. AZ194]|uniref:ABC transporter permease n=1 Tax=Enterococcus sp. AZ194 TaxID=2774629 RepID=UPI003F1F7C17
MKKMLNQEMTKMKAQQIVLKQTIALVVLIFSVALVTRVSKMAFLQPKQMISSLFSSSWLIVFFMVYQASQIFSMEFRYGTIKNLLRHKKSRQELFLAKFLMLLGYSLYFNFIALMSTLALSFVLFPNIPLEGFFHQNTILSLLMGNVFGGFVGLWLFSSLSLLFSLLINNESLASMIGIETYFISSMIAGVQFMILNQASWLKWNPFNMLNLANQLMNTSMTELTHLSTRQLLIGNVFYIVIFILISGMLFMRKKI